MSARRLVSVGAAISVLVLACSSSSSAPDTSGTLVQVDADAIALMLMTDIERSSVTDLEPAKCTPDHATPVQQCSAGGTLSTTINQSCPSTSETSCCSASPPSCKEWTAKVSGSRYKTFFNGCKPTKDVVHSGTIDATMTGSITAACSGFLKIDMQIVHDGVYSVRVFDREACSQGIHVTTSISLFERLTITMQGTICGRRIALSSRSSCFVDCGGDKCCPSGSYCGKCGNCLPSTFPVDCCELACPAGSTCKASQCG